MNTVFRDMLSARAAAAVAAASAARHVNHKALKGLLRKILVRELLRPSLPPNIGVGHGIVVTGYEEQSTEQDIVIFNRAAVPALTLDEVNGVFPIESVLFTIEVKSLLDSTSLKKTHQKAILNERLLHTPGEQAPEHFIQCLFAFDSRRSKKSWLDRYKKIIADAPGAVRLLCVVGRGCWFWQADHWETIAADASFSEVLGFVASIVNVYDRVASTRARPNLFGYIR